MSIDDSGDLAESTEPAPAATGLIGRRAVLLLGAAATLTACGLSTPDPQGSSTASPRRSPSTVELPPGPPSSPPTPGPTPGSSQNAREVVQGPRRGSALALTFHGAGDPALAQRILSAAEKAGAHVTILAVGTWLLAYPQMGRRVLAGGHELGNHTLHHQPMAGMDEATAYAEIVGGRQQVERFVTAPTWFRPSGTPRATKNILAAAGRAGYGTSLSYDVDPRDYTDPGAAVVTSRVLTQARAGSIVSLHLGHVGTAEAMPAILAGLHQRGLVAVTTSRLLTGVTP